MIYKTIQSAYSAGNNYVEAPIFYPESAREIEPEKRVVAIFDVPADNLNQKIAYVASAFVEIEIDGVVMPSVDTYQFDSAGLHTVKYTLSNDDKIPSNTFSTCKGIISVTIPDSVTSINQNAFSGCSGLVNITIPDGVTSIGISAFNGCTSLTNIIIPNNVTTIALSAFNTCSNLTSLTIGSSVASIGNFAFANCTSLTSVTIPDSVTTLGNGVFQNCTNLASVTSLATTAPTISTRTFQNVASGGTLYVPTGSTGYNVWMGSGDYYLGQQSWTKVEQ